MDIQRCMQDERHLKEFMTTKPRLFKRNGLWMARLGDRLTVGNTPKQAYCALMWAGFKESVYG